MIAIAIVAYAVANLLHEGVGHGGACLLTGGRPLVLSTVHFDCSADNRIVDAGGTMMNFLAGAVAWRILRWRALTPRAAYFAWLGLAVNLFQAAGYFLFSGVTNLGDWAQFIIGLGASWVWRLGLVIVGAGLYAAFVWLALKELLPFVGNEDSPRWRRARLLTLVPYLAGGVLSCVAGLFNPVGMVLVAISAAAASLGGTSGLAWMWEFFRDPRFPPSEGALSGLTRSPAWILSGSLVAIVFIGFLGPSVRFH